MGGNPLPAFQAHDAFEVGAIAARHQADCHSGCLRGEAALVLPALRPARNGAARNARTDQCLRRHARYAQVVQLNSQGWSQRTIARGASGCIPSISKLGRFPNVLPPLHAHSRSSRMWSICGRDGNRGSTMDASCSMRSGRKATLRDSTSVYVAIQPWRTHGPTAGLAAAQVVQQYPSYSRHPNPVATLQRGRTEQEQRFVQSVLEQSELIARAYDYLRRFRQILRRARRDRFAAMGVRSRGESDSRTCAFREDGCVWIGKPSKMLCCLPPVKGKSRAR
jgi:hypothetical protein